MQNIRVASVQFNHAPGDKDANMGKIRAFLRDAAMAKVELIVFPEMCITGYWHVRKLSRDEIDALAEPVPSGPSTQELLALSGEHTITVGAGLIERAEDDMLYNTYVVAMPNGQIARHRKLTVSLVNILLPGTNILSSISYRSAGWEFLSAMTITLVKMSGSLPLKGQKSSWLPIRPVGVILLAPAAWV